MLAEFASVVDAVRCAVEIQQTLRTKNAELSAQRRMEHWLQLYGWSHTSCSVARISR